ncbi:MAG: ABC transporter ATP-binding protein [Clostridiales bacterium]|nr:ABC transporter ATP-binding protein [Clostridiales bacterium]
MNEIVVELRDVKKVYPMGGERILALDGVSLQFARGRVYCLVGVSGSGKTTLLNMIAGLERPTHGQIVFKGRHHIETMSEKKLAIFRQRYVGFVFQSYNLLPTLTALENTTLPLIFRRVPRRVRNKRAMQMLKAVGLGSRWRHKPNEMSGGQQQRVSIARAFVNQPEIVFCDEPTGNLDSKTTAEMMNLICGMAKKYNQTLILVTHNLELSRYCDEVIHIRDGKIESTRDVSAEKVEIKSGGEL